MSVLSRARQQQHVTLPDQRTAPATVPEPGRSTTPPTATTHRLRAAAVLAAAVVTLGAAGTGVWTLVEDDGTAAVPTTTIVDTTDTEAERDAAQARRGDGADRLTERVRTETQRDAAQARRGDGADRLAERVRTETQRDAARDGRLAR